MEEFVTLGRIINVRGLKGEMKIMSSTDFASLRYKKDNEVFFYDEETNNRLTFTVEHHSTVKPFDYLIVKEINNVDDANKYRNYLIQVKTSSLPSLDSNTFYYYQLRDSVVIINDNKIGKVIAIEEYGKQVTLRVKTETKEILIPFVKVFINKVDIENKIIYVNDVEGLL